MRIVDMLWVAIPALSSLLYAVLLYNIATRNTYLEPAERWRVAFLLLATLWSLSSIGFIAHLLARPQAQRIATIGTILYGFIALLIVSGLVVRTARFVHGYMEIELGPAIIIAGLYWVVYMYGAGLLALRERWRTPNPEFRQRIDYLLGVVVLLIVGNTLNLTPLRSYPIDILFAALFSLSFSTSSSFLGRSMS